MLQGRPKVLGVKIESTAGTEEELSTSTDYGMYIYEASFTPQPNLIQRQPHIAYDGNIKAIVTGVAGQLTLRTELKGGSDPLWTRLLNACKFTKATGGWHPITSMSNQKTATIYYHHSGRLKKLVGATGNVVLRMTAGQIAMAEWTFTGISLDWEDEAMPNVTYETTAPLIVSCVQMTLGGVTPIINEIAIDMGNTVSSRPAITACNGGVMHYMVSTRNPTATFDPEAVLVATRDVYGQLKDGTELALSIELTGGTGNTVTITAPKVQITGLAEAERNGLAVDSITAQLNESSGDDCINIALG